MNVRTGREGGVKPVSSIRVHLNALNGKFGKPKGKRAALIQNLEVKLGIKNLSL